MNECNLDLNVHFWGRGAAQCACGKERGINSPFEKLIVKHARKRPPDPPDQDENSCHVEQ